MVEEDRHHRRKNKKDDKKKHKYQSNYQERNEIHPEAPHLHQVGNQMVIHDPTHDKKKPKKYRTNLFYDEHKRTSGHRHADIANTPVIGYKHSITQPRYTSPMGGHSHYR